MLLQHLMFVMTSDVRTERNNKLKYSQLFAAFLEQLTSQQELCHQVYKKDFVIRDSNGNLWP